MGVGILGKLRRSRGTIVLNNCRRPNKDRGKDRGNEREPRNKMETPYIHDPLVTSTKEGNRRFRQQPKQVGKNP